MFAGIGAGAAAFIIIIVVVVIVRSRRHNAAPAVKPANSGSHMSDEFMYMNPAYGAPVLGNQQHGSGISQAHVGSGGAGANDRIPYYASSSHAAASSANGTAGHYTTPTAAAAGGAREYMTPQSAYETTIGGYATLSPDHARYATSGYAEARADGNGESGAQPTIEERALQIKMLCAFLDMVRANKNTFPSLLEEVAGRLASFNKSV